MLHPKAQHVLGSALLVLAIVSPAFGEGKKAATTKVYTPLTSIEGYTTMGQPTASSLTVGANYANQEGHYDEAIKLCRKALNKNPNDMDLHKEYAESLENKISTQEDRDPYLFNECLHEWLIVLRSEVGDERGMTVHGLGLPGFGSMFADEDRTGLARWHLKKLAGITPRPWETDAKYLKRASVNSSNTVRARIMSKPAQQAPLAPRAKAASVPGSEAQ